MCDVFVAVKIKSKSKHVNLFRPNLVFFGWLFVYFSKFCCCFFNLPAKKTAYNNNNTDIKTKFFILRTKPLEIHHFFLILKMVFKNNTTFLQVVWITVKTFKKQVFFWSHNSKPGHSDRHEYCKKENKKICTLKHFIMLLLKNKISLLTNLNTNIIC